MRSTIHEMRNQLTVAVGNIEAFLDGKLAPTPQRLTAVLGALHALDSLMSELPSSAGARPPAPKLEPADMCALMSRWRLRRKPPGFGCTWISVRSRTRSVRSSCAIRFK
jgi:hypothetical protein